MPSTATDPSGSSTAASSAGKPTVIQCELAFRRDSRRRCRSRRRGPGRSARRPGRRRASRARDSPRVPASSAPSVVTRAVSGPTSTRARGRRPSTTVRHTPFTARLSPGAARRRAAVATRGGTRPASASTAATVADASMSPVNIAFDQHVGAERLAPACLRGSTRCGPRPSSSGTPLRAERRRARRRGRHDR